MKADQQSLALKLAAEYRPTMPAEVMHLWAQDVVNELGRLAVVEIEHDALRAELAQLGEPVAWEFRHFDESNTPAKWGEWQRVEARNPNTSTVGDAVRDIQAYIDRGYKYELRGLCSPNQWRSRCRNCDDTGDVTSMDGEWRGICDCQAGDEIRNRPAPVAQPTDEQRDGVLLSVIQRLNQNPYSLTKYECIDEVQAMRANGITGAQS